jgi:hypothetical protein
MGFRQFHQYVVNIGRWSSYEGGQLDRFYCTYSTNICTEYSVLFSSKYRLFNNSTSFGFCIIHILNTGVQKFKKNSGVKGLNWSLHIRQVPRPIIIQFLLFFFTVILSGFMISALKGY